MNKSKPSLASMLLSAVIAGMAASSLPSTPLHHRGPTPQRKPGNSRKARTTVPGQRHLERHQMRYRHALTDYVTDKNLARRAQRKAV